MPCTSPKTVGFLSDGKTICWSPKKYSKEFAPFQLPCGKCISCRLEYARQWAIRCIHEAQMHEQNSFITLTYDDQNLVSPKLIYKHFQDFMKRLRRKNPHLNIGVFVTGEYGEINKRPHWHAIIFNYRPHDCIYKYSNHRGDKIYSSAELTTLWPYGQSDVGSVTLESAGYCARYAAKKLVHGHDDQHDYKPISKKSNKHAIGKTWLEKYWPDVFNHGYVILPDGSKAGIPRYYEKWLQKEQPGAWTQYRIKTKQNIINKITKLEEERLEKEFKINDERLSKRMKLQITQTEAKKIILRKNFEKLQKNLKL